MGQTISQVLAFAVGVAISPIPIIAVILMLFTSRAKANGIAFLVGWAGGLAVLVTAAYLVVDAANGGDPSSSGADSTSTVKIVLGVVLLVLALRRWRKRPGPDAAPEMPKWMAGIDHFTPVRAAGLAVLLAAVNPKNFVLTVGAAAGVAQLGGSTGDAVIGLVAFVVVASATVATAVGYRVIGGERSRAQLDGAKAWLTTHNDAVMAVLLVVFGIVLVADGTGRLSA